VNPEQIRFALEEYDSQIKAAGSPRQWPAESFVPQANTSKSTELRTLQHLRWMVQQALGFLIEADRLLDNKAMLELRAKAMRWLCFMQGVLWIQGAYTINEMKDHNRPRDEAGINTKEL